MPESQITVKLIHHCGDDLDVVNAARVSFDKESQWDSVTNVTLGVPPSIYTVPYKVLSKADQNLIRYLGRGMSTGDWEMLLEEVRLSSNAGDMVTVTELMKQFRNTPMHLSPFGHQFASFTCTAPIFVCRQLVKHKFLRWNEVSRRYVDSEPEFYTPDTWRKKANNVKQGSSSEAAEWQPHSLHEKDICERASKLYKDMLDVGISAEQARMVLPQSMMTTWRWSGSLDAFAAMCKLRLDSHTQYESRLVAQQIDKEMRRLFPYSWAALVD